MPWIMWSREGFAALAAKWQQFKHWVGQHGHTHAASPMLHSHALRPLMQLDALLDGSAIVSSDANYSSSLVRGPFARNAKLTLEVLRP
jgi:hypothetical protein